MQVKKAYEQQWDKMFEGLKAAARDNGGDPNVPRKHHTHGEWFSRQRRAYKSQKLAADRVQALEKLGVKWHPRKDLWDEMFEGLKVAARDNGGDPNVPYKHRTHGVWLSRQRRAYKAQKLAADRVQALEKLGVKWVVNPPWDEMFEGLKVAALKNGGNPNVPITHRTHGVWLNRQRVVYKAQKMAADRVQALEKLGVKWYPRKDL